MREKNRMILFCMFNVYYWKIVFLNFMCFNGSYKF